MKIVGHGNNTKYQFKITTELKDYGYSKEVIKTQQDFFNLEKAMNKDFEQNPILKIQLNEIQMNLESQLSSLEHYNIGQMISIIQSYLNLLSGRLDYYTKTYLDFLQIDELWQIELFKLKKHSPTILGPMYQDSGVKTVLVSHNPNDIIAELDETLID